MANPLPIIKQLAQTLHHDRDERLLLIDQYLRGIHRLPYMPDSATQEYQELARRCVTNVTSLLSNTPGQAMYVDAYRRSSKMSASTDAATPEMDHWQRSRLDARQVAVHLGAMNYGHSFTVTLIEKRGPYKGKAITRGLSALRTSALFEDAANDIIPEWLFTVKQWPKKDGTRGTAKAWDSTYEYDVSFAMLSDLDSFRITGARRHGASDNPGTRFAATVDLDGRTIGVIEPMIPLQDRINQTVFDLLVAQSGGSFFVRTVTGMAPPIKRNPETGEPELDENGQPQALPINVNAKTFLFAEDQEARFGQLSPTPLSGYIESIDMSFRHFSALGQVPPHHLLGQIANLSADALQAAETSLLRLVQMFKASFGESWERVFQLAAELTGDSGAAEAIDGEVIWRDMEQKSLAQAADALGKMKEQLDIPAEGLWHRVPDATQNEIENWKHLKATEPAPMLADAVQRATLSSSTLPGKAGQVASDLPPAGA